mmetsp:Transcript_29369/g.67459  ORF Transcript_29369/g.67459 Transcript_29369/m.67459 type:complete len:208 (+) Transcript_29369:535-1158(+)
MVEGSSKVRGQDKLEATHRTVNGKLKNLGLALRAHISNAGKNLSISAAMDERRYSNINPLHPFCFVDIYFSRFPSWETHFDIGETSFTFFFLLVLMSLFILEIITIIILVLTDNTNRRNAVAPDKFLEVSPILRYSIASTRHIANPSNGVDFRPRQTYRTDPHTDSSHPIHRPCKIARIITTQTRAKYQNLPRTVPRCRRKAPANTL